MDVYETTFDFVRRHHNQSSLTTVGDLVDSLEECDAVSKEDAFQMRLAIMNFEREIETV